MKKRKNKNQKNIYQGKIATTAAVSEKCLAEYYNDSGWRKRSRSRTGLNVQYTQTPPLSVYVSTYMKTPCILHPAVVGRCS